ncbi:cation transporter [Paenibacillus lemnae]|uniref:Heavy-metal-associated domain-containing protein n=1 Tax=Paenibacillus lemnae TaxID=1330551 RepID=A0A848M5F9_PAELE|nr:cation transporter [Paenibacillus lemnae]NMO96358.1 heavy-metal-associated domain-containing protein [Paenibacillus lemnae]
MSQVTLNVGGMSCNHCVNAIEKALKEAGMSGKVDLQAGTVTVDYNESQTAVEQIKETIEEQGYEVV